MRLIDADTLKKCKVYSEERHEYVVAVFNIDNAPTIEWKDIELMGYVNGVKRTIIKPSKIEGHWIEDSGNVACSLCHVIWLYRRTNYCPNCGAKMKGEKE